MTYFISCKKLYRKKYCICTTLTGQSAVSDTGTSRRGAAAAAAAGRGRGSTITPRWKTSLNTCVSLQLDYVVEDHGYNIIRDETMVFINNL